MYSVSIENNGDSKYHAATRHYNFVMDTEGQGANPIDTLLASLCGCIGHQARDYLGEQQISCQGFTVKAEAELTIEKDRLAAITVSIAMKETPLDEQRRTELLKYVERCKIHNTLKAGVTITISLD